jgi:hypothetical protein
MRFSILRGLLISIVSGVLAACAAVDRFGSRIYDHNLTSQDAMNQEIVLNIVRASQYQPLNFIAVTQVTGGQSETLTTGLPTITIGPAQTATQHQFPISNSVASAATGGYQSAPLVSSAFQQGMMSPVSPKVLAYLLASHDRETVFNLVMDSINITSGDTTVRYVNDPSNDEGLSDGCSPEIATSMLRNPKTGRAFLLNEDVCNYSKFVLFLTEGLFFGLSAEIAPPAPGSGGNKGAANNPGGGNAAGNQGTGTNATSAPQATGRLCWDPGLADPKFKTTVRTYMTAICTEKPSTKNPRIIFPFSNIGNLQFNPVFRSPQAIFIALGGLLRDGLADRVISQTPRSKRLFKTEPLVTIISENGAGCYVSAFYNGQAFCVPQGAHKTAVVLDVLEQLRNLSITPGDLNAAFSVRLID